MQYYYCTFYYSLIVDNPFAAKSSRIIMFETLNTTYMGKLKHTILFCPHTKHVELII